MARCTRTVLCGALLAVCALARAPASARAAIEARLSGGSSVAVWPFKPSPSTHADYTRYPTTPADWSTFNATGDPLPLFAALRGFGMASNNTITGAADLLDQYTHTGPGQNRSDGIATVIWPDYPMLWATNLKDVVEEVAKRRLVLTDSECAPAAGRQVAALPFVLRRAERTAPH